MNSSKSSKRRWKKNKLVKLYSSTLFMCERKKKKSNKISDLSGTWNLTEKEFKKIIDGIEDFRKQFNQEMQTRQEKMKDLIP